ncbi:hypothetical protein AGMMS49925_08000 [Deltaproteobacteria bacterium]|nr:hypothetical protein AGMMS49925_08000 [Deltaproteobacteria bacterium]
MRTHPELGIDNGVHYLLGAFRTFVQILLMLKDDATGVVIPDIAGKTQDFADVFKFRRSIERLSHNEAGNGFLRAPYPPAP